MYQPLQCYSLARWSTQKQLLLSSKMTLENTLTVARVSEEAKKTHITAAQTELAVCRCFLALAGNAHLAELEEK